MIKARAAPPPPVVTNISRQFVDAPRPLKRTREKTPATPDHDKSKRRQSKVKPKE